MVGWLCYTSHRQRGHLETAPHLLSLAKDVKLVFSHTLRIHTTHAYILTHQKCMSILGIMNSHFRLNKYEWLLTLFTMCDIVAQTNFFVHRSRGFIGEF